ncbi:XisI protein [Roseofilum sp. Guam]|uniref:XisI protein n=1 Tax=Roseofilum sp. Guam TaxID=2821502 RepID=UPI001B0488DF|nr:XisI protein [Roseofilum sp. Guam]MBP0028751.1 XisI protein [Roseofilum sp. Guam]
MERLNYQEIVQNILESHAKNCSNRQTEVKLLFDTQRDHYQVMNMGWQELRRVFGCLVYIEIKEGKIWIERDGTEIGIANELVEAGIPKQDIVLAFKAPYRRKFTDFAAS